MFPLFSLSTALSNEILRWYFLVSVEFAAKLTTSGSIHFKYLAILILTNHDQSVLDTALPALNSLRYYEFPLQCLKLGAGGEFPKRSSNKRT